MADGEGVVREIYTYFAENFKAEIRMCTCRFEAGQGYECMGELQEASRRSSNDGIRAWTKFIGAYLSHILRRPLAIYQLASQQVSLSFDFRLRHMGCPT